MIIVPNNEQLRALAALLPAAETINSLGRVFSDAGHQLYLVGGSVRDALLGVLGHDLDFTTSARPDETEKLMRTLTHEIWQTGKQFGTISANLDAKPAPWQVEITTFRADSYHADSRKPDVKFGESVEEDLVRRDFTVNAMALDVSAGTTSGWRFVDPLGGLEDLADQVLKTPTKPQISFSDDPLRMMRAARFASQLGFQVSSDTRDAMKEMAERIDIISAERVRDEFSKLLLTDKPRAGLNLLVWSTLANYVLPELPAMRLARDEHMRHKDVYEHSLTVLDQAIALEKARDYVDGKPNPNHQPDLIVRIAALLHDIGKPNTRAFENGKVTFHHHDVVGARMVRKRLQALRYSKDIVEAVTKLTFLHLRFHGYAEGSSGGASSGWTDAAVRRYVRDAGDQLERLHIVTRSDCTTRNQRKADRLRRAYDELEFRIDELMAQEELDAIRPDLDGNQIMEILDVGPGPVVGKAYQYLLSLRLNEGPLEPDAAKQALVDWWQQQKG